VTGTGFGSTGASRPGAGRGILIADG